MFTRKWCRGDTHVALTKKRNSLLIYLQMMKIKKCARVGYFHSVLVLIEKLPRVSGRICFNI